MHLQLRVFWVKAGWSSRGKLVTMSFFYTTVYPKKYAYGFVVLCFVVVMQSVIMNSHEVFIHIHQGCFAGTGAIVRLPQCQWSKPDGYGKISQCITTTKHSKAKTACIFLGIYCMWINTAWRSCHMRSKKWNKVTYPLSNRWSLGINKLLHHTLYNGCNYLSKLVNS